MTRRRRRSTRLDQVVPILGYPDGAPVTGTPVIHSDAGGVVTDVYTWDFSPPPGARVNVEFDNGLVTGKARVGL